MAKMIAKSSKVLSADCAGVMDNNMHLLLWILYQPFQPIRFAIPCCHPSAEIHLAASFLD